MSLRTVTMVGDESSRGRNVTFRTKTVMLGSAVLALVVAAVAFRHVAVEQWYLWQIQSVDPAVRLRAARILGELKSERAIPYLIERIKRPDWNPPASDELFADSANRAALVERGFLAIKSDFAAAEALGRIGRPSIPSLLRVMSGRNATSQRLAMYALSFAGRDAEAAAPILLEQMDHPDLYNRLAAADALITMGLHQTAVIETLIGILREGSPNCRYRAAESLAEVGPLAVKAVTALVASLGDKYRRNRRSAAIALAYIDPALFTEDSRLMDILISGLKEGLAIRPIAEALKNLGSLARPAVPALQQALGEGHRPCLRFENPELAGAQEKHTDQTVIALESALRAILYGAAVGTRYR